ncbi:amidase [Acidipropionibacterium jensenii]|uniref:amidase n=1 Tax=Acidipropionibacterium jensenii TaxID=1749 RepID=UPI00214C0CC6|nr:amidase [Acidipropionibacterium jensenii]
MTERFDVVEASISQLQEALSSNRVTSVELVVAYLNRIAYYDRTGTCLNAVPILNPDVLAEAAASDERRKAGEAGPLEGIPFTVKDSYKVKGLTVAAGSPALAELVSNEDAASIAQLRAAGAVLIGKTNMPPMAAGGIQPGIYGYAHSPYNPQYIAAGYGSGSSNGSGVATASSMCAFGMGEETVSSGRSPASNNCLVAYTPSRGVLSIRGNWPLRPTCDVVVPHTRTVTEMTELLDVLAVKDPRTTGDFWREQDVVTLPEPEHSLPHPVAHPRPQRLDGLRLGVPKLYIGDDTEPLVPPVIRPSVRALWDQAADDLRSLGAEVVEVDLPVVSNYEEDRPSAVGLLEQGLVPPDWRSLEGGQLAAMRLDSFLRENADPKLSSWADVDGDTVFPDEDAPIPVWITRARGGFDWQRMAEFVKQGVPDRIADVPGVAQLLTGLEQARKTNFEDWLKAEGLDAIVFPAAGDVGREDLFSDAESLDEASRNGVVYSNGNRVWRHLGIPTVTVPMGFMADIQMPVGLTFAGPAYSDDHLLDLASAYEAATTQRRPAFLAPSLPCNQIDLGPHAQGEDADASIEAVEVVESGRFWEVTVRMASEQALVWADGIALAPAEPGVYRGRVSLARKRLAPEMLVIARVGSHGASMVTAPLPIAG